MALLQAKDAAEDLGYNVLHMYVDGLWVQQEGITAAEQVQPLLAEITRRTGLPIALDGIFDWIAFLPSRQDSRVPVPNRFFGVFQDGTIKLRGVEARRRDTPRWVASTQEALIALLAGERDPARLPQKLPEAVDLLRRALGQLQRGEVALDDLLVVHKMSRSAGEYQVRFIYTRGGPGVLPLEAFQAAPAPLIDQGRYTVLLLRAAHTVLEPLGIPYDVLFDLVVHRIYQNRLNWNGQPVWH